MNGGVYVVLVRLRRAAEVDLRSGPHRLPPGCYAYIGSARRGLDARVARHLAPDKKVRWHIDRLTTHPSATAEGAVLLQSTPPGPTVALEPADPRRMLTECALNRWVGHFVGGCTPIRGFGAGDCREGCPAHLWRCARPVTPKELASALAEAGFGPTDVVRNPRARD